MHSKNTDFANVVKQSFMAFRKAHDSSFIWHTGCFDIIIAFHRRAIISFERSKETKQRKIAGKHPRLPTNGSIAQQKKTIG